MTLREIEGNARAGHSAGRCRLGCHRPVARRATVTVIRDGDRLSPGRRGRRAAGASRPPQHPPLRPVARHSAGPARLTRRSCRPPLFWRPRPAVRRGSRPLQRRPESTGQRPPQRRSRPARRASRPPQHRPRPARLASRPCRSHVRQSSASPHRAALSRSRASGVDPQTRWLPRPRRPAPHRTALPPRRRHLPRPHSGTAARSTCSSKP